MVGLQFETKIDFTLKVRTQMIKVVNRYQVDEDFRSVQPQVEGVGDDLKRKVREKRKVART